MDKSSLDESVYKFLLKVIKYGLYLLIFVVVLTCLHVPTAPLVTVLGACGAAIALALKDSLGNIASGIIILVNQPFIRGDVIEVAGVTGIVQKHRPDGDNPQDLMITSQSRFQTVRSQLPYWSIKHADNAPRGLQVRSQLWRGSERGQGHPDDRRGILR